MFRRTRTSTTVPIRVAIAGLTGLLVAASGVQPAYAADAGTGYSFAGSAGGTQIRASDGSVVSPLTAPAEVSGDVLTSNANSVAHLAVNGAINTGPVSTSTSTAAVDGGYQVRSESLVDGLSALDGAITATAVQTVSIVRVVNGVTSHSITTTFNGLTIAGKRFPATVPANTHVKLPDVAYVGLNFALASTAQDRAIAEGAGVAIDLLKPVGSVQVADTISAAPATASFDLIPTPCGRGLYAHSFGTRVLGSNLAGIRSGETAPITLPAGGTDSATVTASLAGVKLNVLSHVGAVTDAVTGTSTSTTCDSRATAHVSAINLLNGAIKAVLVTSAARATQASSAAKPALQGSATLQHLVVEGKPVPVNVSPNTKVTLGAVGVVIVNQRLRPNQRSLVVRALDIRLTKAVAGFPAGAEIQIAASRVAIT